MNAWAHNNKKSNATLDYCVLKSDEPELKRLIFGDEESEKEFIVTSYN